MAALAVPAGLGRPVGHLDLGNRFLDLQSLLANHAPECSQTETLAPSSPPAAPWMARRVASSGSPVIWSAAAG